MAWDDVCKGMNLSKSSEALGNLTVLFIILMVLLVPKQIVQAGSLGARGQLLQDAKTLQRGGWFCWTKPTPVNTAEQEEGCTWLEKSPPVETLLLNSEMFIGRTRWPRGSKRQLSLVTTKLLPGVLLLNGHGVPVSETSKARPPFLPWASAFPCLPLFSSQKWVAIISSISQMRRLRHSWDLNPGLLINVQGSFHMTVSLWLRMH